MTDNMKIKTICFDIDNVICKTNTKRNYSKSIPIKKNIKIINQAYSNGYNIVYIQLDIWEDTRET